MQKGKAEEKMSPFFELKVLIGYVSNLVNSSHHDFTRRQRHSGGDAE